VMTLREALEELNREPRGSVLVHDDAVGGQRLPCDVLQELEGDDEGRVKLARFVTQVQRAKDDLDSVIAYVRSDGYEYPYEPRWHVIRNPTRQL
jgi:hypothetical protein